MIAFEYILQEELGTTGEGSEKSNIQITSENDEEIYTLQNYLRVVDDA